jgi:hypothetical protein
VGSVAGGRHLILPLILIHIPSANASARREEEE